MNNTSLALPIPRRSLAVIGGIILWLGAGLSTILLLIRIFTTYSWIGSSVLVSVSIIILYILAILFACVCGFFAVYIPPKNRWLWSSAVTAATAYMVLTAGLALNQIIEVGNYYDWEYSYLLQTFSFSDFPKFYYSILNYLVEGAFFAVAFSLFLFAVISKKRSAFSTVFVASLVAGGYVTLSFFGRILVHGLYLQALSDYALDWLLYGSFYLALSLLCLPDKENQGD